MKNSFAKKFVVCALAGVLGVAFIVQKMVKTLHFQCSDFQFLKMFG
ncbi:MAG: hypothetical protein PUK29_08415 [Fibrobacter sp.]|nr:hypothetical protein [Fibrobacter sp.]MDD7498267.1 hypothetical protein [Fibrobacter sp.]